MFVMSITTKACQSCITSVCFGIAKLWCLWLNIIGYFFSFPYMPMHDMLKKKIYIYIYIYVKKNKSKKNQNTFKYGCKRVSRRCGSYSMYLKGDSPHQAVMIVCEYIWFSHISNRYNMRHLCTSAMFSHTTCKFFTTFNTCASSIWFDHHKEYTC